MPTKINYKEVTIVTRCPLCGHGNFIETNEDDYDDWCDGMNAQNAFPYLDKYEREALISGTCRTCWDKIFK